MDRHVDILIVGAGAAGLLAGIAAGRTRPGRSIVILDGARTLGAKILVAGGGRCNVTHDHVDERAYAGSSPAAIRKVLRRFDVQATVAFFRDLNVELKREESGKLFPVTDSARTVLEALLRAARDADARIEHPRRVDRVARTGDRFLVSGAWGGLIADSLILATGGKSLPKTGSDGAGYEFARALGHTLTDRIFPALVPLTVADGHFIRSLSGVATEAALQVRTSNGRKIVEFNGSTLCTHFGLSGPAVLDISRHFTNARLDDPGAQLVINWQPGETFDSLDALLAAEHTRSAARLLHERDLPDRLARALCEVAGADPSLPPARLRRERRRELARTVTEAVIPITGDRGDRFAEVTAGGVPLRELRLDTMESRLCPNLHVCGEICDVDGRIGGYNFQWAWASGHVAGVSVGLRAEPNRTHAPRGSGVVL